MLPGNHETYHMEKDAITTVADLITAAVDITATSSGGNWSDTSTWVGGVVPGAGDNVVIPQGSEVIYDTNSTTAIGLIRVNGILKWSNTATRLRCDSIIGTPFSYIEIGNRAQPITASALIEWVDGALIAGDTNELSRGLVSNGRVSIRGATKTPFARLNGTVSSGSTSVTVETVGDISEWAVGDTVHIPPTEKGDNNDSTVTTISSISSGTITLASGLVQTVTAQANGTTKNGGHSFPRKPYILNETRTIRFVSLGSTRGHMMLSHRRPPAALCPRQDNPNVHRTYPTVAAMGENADPGIDVRWASFESMGRTQALSSPQVGEAGNQVGRYPVHIHRVGYWNMDPVVVQGCSAVDNRIWAFVHHDSFCHFDQNICRNTTGAGMVCEADTEFGYWTNNFMTNCFPGSGNGEDEFNGHARTGDAYAPDRAVLMQGNKAANCKHGIQLHQSEVSELTRVHDGNEHFYPPQRVMDYEGLKRTGCPSSPVAFPIHEAPNLAQWQDHEFYACTKGIRVFHRQAIMQYMTFWAILDQWNMWNVGTAWDLPNYTWNYIIKDGAFQGDSLGINLGDKLSGLVWVNCDFKSFTNFIFPVTAALNPMGGFVDLTFSDGTSMNNANASNTGIAMTNHDSAGWVETFTAPASLTDDWVDTMHAEGVPRWTQSPANDGNANTANPIIAEWGLGQNIFRDGVPTDTLSFNDYPDQKKHVLTDEELVQQIGCYNNGSNDVVPLDFYMPDRFTATYHAFRIEHVVDSVSSALRAANTITEPAAPSASDLNLLPPALADDSLTTYGVKQDATTGCLFIFEDDKVRLDAYGRMTDIMVGNSSNVAVDVVVSDGSTTSVATITFDVTGRGAVPSQDSNPVISRHGVEITGAMDKPTNAFSRGSVSFYYGDISGFPEPKIGVTMKVDAVTRTTPKSHLEKYFVAEVNADQTVQIETVLTNRHGTTTAAASNPVTFGSP